MVGPHHLQLPPYISNQHVCSIIAVHLPTQLREQEINAVPSTLDMDRDLISIPSRTLLITIQINHCAAESKTCYLLSSPK